MEHLILGGYGWQVPDFTPGLEERVQSGFRNAKLKDVGGSVSYEDWWNEGGLNGWNATTEFVKAVNPQPDKNARKDGMTAEKMLEENPGAFQALWTWYIEKKMPKNSNATESEKSSETSSPNPAEPQ